MVRYKVLDEIHKIQEKHYEERKHLSHEEYRNLLEEKTKKFLKEKGYKLVPNPDGIGYRMVKI